MKFRFGVLEETSSVMKKSLSATVMCALVFNSGEQERHELDVIEIK